MLSRTNIPVALGIIGKLPLRKQALGRMKSPVSNHAKDPRSCNPLQMGLLNNLNQGNGFNFKTKSLSLAIQTRQIRNRIMNVSRRDVDIGNQIVF